MNISSTLETYVAKMEQHDSAHGRHDETITSAPNIATTTEDSSTLTTNSPGDLNVMDGAAAAEAVGLKSHHKKSNAVGDPNDDDSDDDEEEEALSDWANDEHDEQQQQQLHIEVELVEEHKQSSAKRGGLKLGRPRQTKNKPHAPTTMSQALLNAWSPHIFLPPTPSGLAHLHKHAKSLDQYSKIRLDRRTLYAGLLLEWTSQATTRKYLSKVTSQSLQAALSMATQPQWRQAFPQSSGIMLYNSASDATAAGTPTLAMQETIAMALAHSLGCGMVVVDDTVIANVRNQLQGYPDDDIKPAALLEGLLTMAKEGKLTTSTGSVAKRIQLDLETGLEDPFDDRAKTSFDDMELWEGESKMTDNEVTESRPLVVFVRTQASTSLFKSKSAVEYLMQECTSADSIHLLVLGKGIDANTATLPVEVPDLTTLPPQQQYQPSQQFGEGGEPMMDVNSPWFGFSAQNQNASGQNDPEGSRRFNIFLARTLDGEGNPGILGAIAPPQAGNLFPQMMAMQARERMEGEEDSPAKAELERWAEMLSQQMDHGSGPLPGPPPQFFNASLINTNPASNANAKQPPPEVVQQALQTAMSELLDRLASMESDSGDDFTSAFSQLLKNENLRHGIAENLSRAAPALTDPKCQGVMLSVYVPPMTRPKPGWFQKILNIDESEGKKNRVRTAAAAAAMVQANREKDGAENNSDRPDKWERHLKKVESLCRSITIATPADPVRAKSWEGWIARERGAVVFRRNRRSLVEELSARFLSLQQKTGSCGAGSALRQMLSVRDIGDEMEDVIKFAIELEASKSIKDREVSEDTNDLEIDYSLSQLLMTDDGLLEETTEYQYIHPSNLEAALSMSCRISPFAERGDHTLQLRCFSPKQRGYHGHGPR